MQINYRLAVERDLRTLAEMRWDFRTEEEEAPADIDKETFIQACTEFLSRGLVSKQWVYWLAENNNGIIAHVFIQCVQKVPKPQQLNDSYGYITNVYTKPDWRGQGIGFELMEQSKTWAKDEDLDTLIAWPSKNSINFYKRLGFQSQNDVMEFELREA